MPKCNKEILKRLKQKKKGSTLLEIVISLAIIGIIMIPLGGALVTSVKSNKMGEIKQESKLISQEIIEKVRSIGDVKNTTLQIGKEQSDGIEIKQVMPKPIDPLTGKEINIYDVEGTLKDSEGTTMVTGTIKEKGNFKEEYGSMSYLDNTFGLFIYIQNHENGNKISYYKGNKTIDEYLSRGSIPLKTIENCKELKIEIGGDDGENALSINGVKEGTLITTTPSGFAEIGVYVEGQRRQTDLIDLHLNNKNSDTSKKVELFLFNNKFHGINHDGLVDQVTDSFKEDRYINGEFTINDNIKYHKVAERLNKGLYTIDLDFKKKIPNGTTVTEKTVSEFMVDN